MDLLDAFNLYRSRAATIRVEPPDLVIIDDTLRFRRSELRACQAMLASHYRARHDRTFVAINDDIIVRLMVGGRAVVLGPFPHHDGLAIASAIDLARYDLLFAMPGFSVSVGRDGESLVIETRSGGAQVSIPVPTEGLVALLPRATEHPDAVTAISTGLRPTVARWIEIAFVRGELWSLGPLSPSQAATLTLAFRAWRAEHPIDPPQPLTQPADDQRA